MFRQIQNTQRRGATMTLFAILLPVLVLLSAMAVNIAYMQLTATELKVAVDASAKAGGRALSIHQTTDSAWSYAQSTASLNSVSGTPLSIQQNETDIQFGISHRLSNGYGRYAFTPVSKADVDGGAATATSVKVTGDSVVPLLFRGFASFTDFSPTTYSVATQVDRDIAVVLDRSGSMAYNENEEEYLDELLRLRNNGSISSSEYNDATDGLYDRYANGDVLSALPQAMSEYASDLNAYNNSNGNAPRHSRWSWVEAGVEAFLQVLESTDQEEQVSLATFANTGRLDHYLEYNYANVRDTVGNMRPYNATAIGQGMEQALTTLLASQARPFASKTIVVLTDGVNNVNPTPASVAEDIIDQHNVTIHTVTFSDGADTTAMESVATIGGGRHYHATTGAQLVTIFEEIANNLPTIITE